jgi:hypothetical protein
MLTLLDPMEPALDADATAATFEVTYTPDAQGNGTIQIPVSISSDGVSLAVKCPPVAVPIGTWNLVWDFTLDSNVPPVLISISQLLGIPEFVSVTIQPPARAIDSSQLLQVTATVVNQLPPRQTKTWQEDLSTHQIFNGFGYWLQVSCASLNPALHNSSMAIVQDQFLDSAGGPPSFTLAYTMDPVNGNRLNIPVFVRPVGDLFVAKAPPAALPIGGWRIVWDFTGLPTGLVALNVLGLADVTNFFEVHPAESTLSTLSTSCTAGTTNLLPIPVPLSDPSSLPEPNSQQVTAFGYFLHVVQEGNLLSFLTAWDPSIAVVQDPIVG